MTILRGTDGPLKYHTEPETPQGARANVRVDIPIIIGIGTRRCGHRRLNTTRVPSADGTLPGAPEKLSPSLEFNSLRVCDAIKRAIFEDGL